MISGCLLMDSGRAIRLIAPRLPDHDVRRRRHVGVCAVGLGSRADAFGERAPKLRSARMNCLNRPFGMASIPDGIVTVNIIRAEMGQHVGTALARIVADELEADWSKVRIVTVDTDPKWGIDDHWRKLVGVAEFPGAKPVGRGRTHCSDRGRRKAAWRSVLKFARHATARFRQEEDRSSYGDIVARGNLRRTLHARAT